MLEHQKIVIKGVIHDKDLFKKELIKSLCWLESGEQQKFQQWIIDNYKNIHPEIIDEIIYSKINYAS